MTNKEITIDDEIAELIRELGMRRSVYPKWTSGPSARMKKEDAERYILAMTTTLKRLQRIKAEMSGVQTELFS